MFALLQRLQATSEKFTFSQRPPFCFTIKVKKTKTLLLTVTVLEPLTFNSQSGSSGSLDPLTVTVSTHSGGKCSSSELDFVASEFYCEGGLKEVDTDPNHQRWTQPEASLFSEKNGWSFMKLCFQRSENESKCELHVLVAVAFRQVQSVRTVSPSTGHLFHHHRIYSQKLPEAKSRSSQAELEETS